ncbi:hypothetical protein ACFLYD_06190 [Chloroflexota bacterium]
MYGSNIWGDVRDGPITITTPYSWTVMPWGGNFDWWAPDEFEPGDRITVEAGAGLYPVVIDVPTPFDAAASSLTDKVWGRVDHLDHEWLAVDLSGGPTQQVQTNYTGTFTTTFDDVPRGGRGEVRYMTQFNYVDVSFHRDFQSPDLFLEVFYDDDVVQGAYEVGHTVWITVTESANPLDPPKATAKLTTQGIPWWGGEPGFHTELEDAWDPGPPDIVPGNWVFGRVDNGYSSALKVGEITGNVDSAGDGITGTVAAAWLLPSTVEVQCHAWGAPWDAPNPENKWDEIQPNGAEEYGCWWDPGTEWDVEPGQEIGVSYYEPDGDSVWTGFREAAPDVQVEKWPRGHGVAPGGPVIFAIRYRNGGDVAAGTVLLTDTLPANTTYLTDTSGIPASVSGGLVSWSVGPLAPGADHLFQLVLTNTASISDTLHNEVDIYSQYDQDEGNNHAEADIHVADGAPDIWVQKHPSPGDPVPGQNFLYEIEYGNNGVGSGPVVLTDTLPENTSVVSWTVPSGFDLWTEVSRGDQLVLASPSVPGFWGSRILLRLELDGGVAVGTQLTNTVEISTTGDTDPGNNEDVRDDVWAGDPRWNGEMQKTFGWGELVPGGKVYYYLYFRNEGNMPASVTVTDTLPAHTTFDRARRWPDHVNVPFPPDDVDDEVAVWHLGVLEPGEYYELGVQLDIDNDAPLGTFTNCATIDLAGDGVPDDDTSCVVRRVNNVGDNLRVYKTYSWNGDGQLHYDIYFENVGTTDLSSVWITDTYPISTTFANWWTHYHTTITETHYPGQRQVVFWVEEVLRGDMGHINLEVDLDGAVVGRTDLTFTNRVEAPIPGDVWPPDNEHEVTAHVGHLSLHYLVHGWNLLAPNVDTDPPTSAAMALDEIEFQGGDAPEIYHWLSNLDIWEGHSKGGSSDGFLLELGQGYFVRSSMISTWRRTGWPRDEPVPVALDPTWTLMGLPKLPGPMQAADLLAEATDQGGDCTEIYRWVNGNWVGHSRGSGFNNFWLTEYEGYFVKCAQHIVYTPGGLGRAAARPTPVESAILESKADPVLSDVQVTNLRDVAFSVTWQTDRPSSGWVEYGRGPDLGQVAYDDRGRGVASRVHQVTITGLQPEAIYYLRLHSGEVVDDRDGALYQVTTPATGELLLPLLAYGPVETASGEPAVGALVRAWLLDADGAPLAARSALVDGWGTWNLSLSLADCAGAQLALEAAGPEGHVRRLTLPACEARPAPLLVLGEERLDLLPLYLPLVQRTGE